MASGDQALGGVASAGQGRHCVRLYGADSTVVRTRQSVAGGRKGAWGSEKKSERNYNTVVVADLPTSNLCIAMRLLTAGFRPTCPSLLTGGTTTCSPVVTVTTPLPFM